MKHKARNIKYKIITNNTAQTRKLGEKLAKKIVCEKPKLTALVLCEKAHANKALVIGLSGELGSGKTTFLQGFAKGLGIKEKILSPTFVIYKKFSIFNFQFSIKSQTPIFKNFYHIDCYRLQKPKELLDLGFKEIISNPKNIVAIEWADKIKKTMPQNSIWIYFDFINEKKRKITI